MPTEIRYFSNGEALVENVLNRPHEDVEANLTEIFTDGIPKWNTKTTYNSNSLTKYNGLVYKSLRTNLNKNPSTQSNDWEPYEGNRQATLSKRGTVTISDATDSNSSTTAASSKAVNQVKSDIQPSLIPVGSIVMWSGSIANIPAGWALCDGTGGTPNLQNRFVVGAGDTYAVGDTGGADSVTLTESEIPAHNHSASSETAGNHDHSASSNSAGNHSHSGSANSGGYHNHSLPVAGGYNDGQSKISGNSKSNTGTRYTNSGGTHSHSLSINSNGSHSHTITVNSGGDHTHIINVENAGGGAGHENRPPYYALAFIMKI